MKLSSYFKSPHLLSALDAYRSSVPETWTLSHRLELYSYAEIAFNSLASATEKEQAFTKIYQNLTSYWGVFRGTSLSERWSAETLYSALTTECLPCGRSSGLSLASITDSRQNPQISACLNAIGKLKATKNYPSVYPWMAAAKFLHFFNPELFPIYDTAFMWNRVANGAFKQDYAEYCGWNGFKRTENSARFNLQYTLWAAEVMSKRDDDCMAIFAQWVAEQVKGENGLADVVGDLETYYAAAFEMVAIGAAKIEMPW
jgi:hypothetical protein